MSEIIKSKLSRRSFLQTAGVASAALAAPALITNPSRAAGTVKLGCLSIRCISKATRTRPMLSMSIRRRQVRSFRPSII
jgi:hypothetical protein